MKSTLTSALLLGFAGVAQAQSTVEIFVGSGENRGDHRLVGTGDACAFGKTGAGSWTSQFTGPKDVDPKKLNGVNLLVPDAKGAAAGGSEFQLSIAFGPRGNRAAVYAIDTRQPNAKKGGGTVTIDDRGKTGIVKFTAISPEGVKIEGTIDCKNVVR